MFSFLPQLLIILCLLGIIVIVLRKVPGVPEFLSKTPLTRLPAQGAKLLWAELKTKAAIYLKKLWHFVLEVKEVSKSRGLSQLPQAFSRIRLPAKPLKFLRRPADSAEEFMRLAEESLAKGDYQEAERKFIKVIKMQPRREEAYAGLGRLYLVLKKFADAIETFKFLVKHYPTNDAHYASLGQAYHGEKLYDQAIEAYEKAIELSPENPKRYINLGLTLEARKREAEAILNYRKAVALEKDNPQYFLILAEALIKKGDKEEAEIALGQVLRLDPTNHVAREKLMQLKF